MKKKFTREEIAAVADELLRLNVTSIDQAELLVSASDVIKGLLADRAVLLVLVVAAKEWLDAVANGETWVDGSFRDIAEWVSDADSALRRINEGHE